MAEQYGTYPGSGDDQFPLYIVQSCGDICGMAQRDWKQIYPHPGWVEQNLREICHPSIPLRRKNGIDAKQIKGIGITNQRETTIIWKLLYG